MKSLWRGRNPVRPASEIHSALDVLESELSRQTDPAAIHNLTIARDVLAWVAGRHWVEVSEGSNPWLVAFLMDDPPKLDDTPPEIN